MWFVRRKKYDMMIQSWAKLQEQHDELIRDHRDLIEQSDGHRMGLRTLKQELERVSAELFMLKQKNAKGDEIC